MTLHAAFNQPGEPIREPGEPDTAEVLFRSHGRACHSLAMQIIGDDQLAADTVTDVFTALARQPVSERPDGQAPPAGLLAETHRRAVGLARQDDRRHLRRSARQLLHMLAASAAGPPNSAGDRPGRGAVLALPPAERDVVVLAYFGGYTQAEIAELTGSPIDTVRQRTRAAMSRLDGKTREVPDRAGMAPPPRQPAAGRLRPVRRLRLLIAAAGPCVLISTHLRGQ